jgi:hypothetical protein
MWLIYSTYESLFLSTVPDHIDAFVLTWHEFKNSVAVQIGFLHSQPFTIRRFRFFIIVESAISRVLHQRTPPLPPPGMEGRQGKGRTVEQ